VRRLIGFALFWIAAGMMIELLIKSILVSMILIFVLILFGYNLFLCG
jgi:hypothetical protein